MGREASVSYFTAEAKKCPCSLFAKATDNCCDDEHGLLKLDNFQKNIPSFAISLPSLVLWGDLYDASVLLQERSPSFASFTADANPPPKVLFKLYCSYVFYDDVSIA